MILCHMNVIRTASRSLSFIDIPEYLGRELSTSILHVFYIGLQTLKKRDFLENIKNRFEYSFSC